MRIVRRIPIEVGDEATLTEVYEVLAAKASVVARAVLAAKVSAYVNEVLAAKVSAVAASSVGRWPLANVIGDCIIYILL
jgi:hypothetical protein